MATLGGFILIWIILLMFWLALYPVFERIGGKIIAYFKRNGDKK